MYTSYHDLNVTYVEFTCNGILYIKYLLIKHSFVLAFSPWVVRSHPYLEEPNACERHYCWYGK